MEFDQFARQQDSAQGSQQWSPDGQQQPFPQPPQPPQGQPPQFGSQPPQWQPGQFGSQPPSEQAAWGQQPQWPSQSPWPMQDPGRFAPGRFRPRRRFRARGAALIGSLIGVAGAVIAVVAATHSPDSSSSPSAASPGAAVSLPALPAQSAAPAGASTATLVVTGSSGARVTYGPAGTDIPGSAPMRKTVALGSASTYEVKAQLTGSGTLGCQVLVGDKVISQATATGAYGVAVCVIFRNPVSGQWQNAMAG